jgi:hypothetical protein
MAGFKPRKIFNTPAVKPVDEKKQYKEQRLLNLFVKLSLEMVNKGATETDVINFANTPSTETLTCMNTLSPLIQSVLMEINKHTTESSRIKALEEFE